MFFSQGRCHCRKDMKWNSEAKECQVGVLEFRKGSCTKYFASLHISFSQQISHHWSPEDFHGRGLFDDHVRDSALPRNIVRGRPSQGKPGRGWELSCSWGGGWLPEVAAPFVKLSSDCKISHSGLRPRRRVFQTRCSSKSIQKMSQPMRSRRLSAGTSMLSASNSR